MRTVPDARPSSRSKPLLLVALCVLLGVLLHLPALTAGFYADDYVLRLGLGEHASRTPLVPWNLYDFGRASDWARFGEELGALPWWTDPDWAARFLRPLSSLTLWLDDALWGEQAIGFHLTNLLLHALLLALSWRLYLALGLAPRVALLALLLLALSDASVVPVGWISNRNSVLAALFAAGALLAVVRGRDPPGRGAVLLAVLLAAGASLAKESGAIAFAVVALALALRRHGATSAPERRRLGRSALLCAALLVAWLVGLALAGYGTRSLYYATPWRDPLRYLDNLLFLATAGVVSLAGPFPLDLATMTPAARWPMAALGALLALPLVVWVARSVAGRAGAPLLAAWTALFLLPQAGVAPSDRLLYEPALGACGLLALFLERLRERRAELPGIARLAGWAVLLAATLGSGASLAVQAFGMRTIALHLRETALATETGTPGTGRRDVVVLQTESSLQGFTLGATWHGAGGDPDVRFALLNPTPRPLRWTRVADDAFELEALDEPFLTRPFEQVYMSREWVHEPARVHRAAPLSVTALESARDGPRRLLVRLPRSLDHPALSFVRPEGGRLSRLPPPPVGASIELEAPVPTLAFVP